MAFAINNFYLIWRIVKLNKIIEAQRSIMLNKKEKSKDLIDEALDERIINDQQAVLLFKGTAKIWKDVV